MKARYLYALGLGILIPILFSFIFLEILPGDIFSNHARKLSEKEIQLEKAKSAEERFYILCDAAKLAFAAEEYDKARLYALELIGLMGAFENNWNYWNAVHDGNMVLGRLALLNGDLVKAKEYLINAGKTPGSSNLDSFGPNMSLARDLIKKGETKVVLEYFELCRRFWKLDFGKLSRWTFYVKLGITPGFGANLLY
ncbi:hypothetical protein [Candidatus Nitronereus thalassa]|uniref:Tetratricopeptide repeat protein n=1 Tax=Candidatus Nitronereus thalassa TaxID=3020898 RepID=A0ABU3KCG7_9BACT|nr:hypothetical protein [Candidatus Nitronereus thalassa]MDT7044210.1 hypothetical protein [Candidatus Nitronereus thalassa]